MSNILRGVPIKSCSKKCYIFTGQQVVGNFIEITLLRRCSPVNLLDIYRTHFHKKTFSGLFLPVSCVCNGKPFRTYIYLQAYTGLLI